MSHASRGLVAAGCFALLALKGAPALAADELPGFKLSSPERRGRGWEQRAEFEVAAKPGGRLVLRADGGSVEVLPGPAEEVKCLVTLRAYVGDESSARRLLEGFRLSARALEPNDITIRSQSPPRARLGSRSGAHFQVSVPQRFNVDVETQGGEISVESALEGKARLTTAGGDVRAAALTGPVRIETAGGNITLSDTDGDLTARTAGGTIRTGGVRGNTHLETSGGDIVCGEVAGALRAETAGGDVVIAGARGELEARTSGGQIQIGPAEGSLRAETSGGSIRLLGARGRVVADSAGGSIDLLKLAAAVRASTTAGRILAQFICGDRSCGSSELETGSGDVYVYLPVDIPLTIDAAIEAAAGHKIQSDFPLEIRGDQGELVPSTLRGAGTLNGGGETLRIRAVAGNIEIRKLEGTEMLPREAASWKAWEERRADKERRRQQREQERQQRQREKDGED